MISIVIPLYNKAATVERTLRSILKQTVRDYEVIVVDNGSTDGGERIVRQINDTRIRLINQDKQGVSAARNKGIEESKYEWVAFLDADDEWESTFLETVLKLAEKYKECDVCATAYYRCAKDGQKQEILLNSTKESKDFVFDNYFEVASQSDPPIHSSSIMAKKSALISIGGFPQGVHQGEDLLTWARLASKYKIAYCREPQSIFYTGEENAMGKPKRIPDPEDPVGKGLEAIYNDNPSLPGIKNYIAHWHKMRASIYLRLPGCSSKSRSEAQTSCRWHRNKKMVFYIILSFVPYKLRMNILKKLN